MDWIYFNRFGIHINMCNPFKTLNKIKHIFKNPELHFIICRPKCFPLMFGYPRGKIFDFQTHDVFWKDKYDTPRFEDYPRISITLFNSITFLWYWGLNDVFDNNNYWEQILWYLNYFKYYNSDKPNIFMAKKSWPWSINSCSSWDDSFLIVNLCDIKIK